MSARFEYSSQKSLKTPGTGDWVSKTPAQIPTKLMKLKPYNTHWLTKHKLIK
jgi:hypothetical protein